jgi:glycosyltransferase involved in cell wall biosynthesis
MRVLVVHSRYRSAAPSGENNVVDQECAALAAAGHDVERFERSSDEIESWPLGRKVLLPVTSLWSRQVRSELADRLRDWRPDVVHVHNTFPMISASMLYACRDAGVPVVATIHNYKLSCANGTFFRDGQLCHECSGTRGLAGLQHRCYRDSVAATLPVVLATNVNRSAWRTMVSAYVFISAAQRALLQDLDLPAERQFVKHNFVPPAPTGVRRAEHLVSYLGRLDAAKGLPFLMRAWDSFRANNPGSALRLAIAGGGPMAAEVSAWGASRDSVSVLGLLTRDDASRLLQRSVATVVPSQWEETFGLVAVEAMAAAVAPLAPSRGAFPELITPGVDGELFAAEDAAGLADLLAEVDQDPERFVALGRAGVATVERRFRAGTSVQALETIYRYAVSNPAVTQRVHV